LAEQATHDPLTGLANRSALYDAITDRLATGASTALLLMDLDGFKDVNDALGHATGDQLLVAIANRLTKATRAGDLVARLGGDEFAVLLGGVGDGADLALVADRIKQALDRPMHVADWRLPVRASLGGAVVAPAEGDAGVLLQHADIAMYRAKRSHRDIAVYGTEDEEDRTRTLVLAAALPDAITTGAVTAHYQPKVDLATGRIVGVEALARWTHPILGPVRPDVFVPLAEHNGLILRLTEHMLDLAIAQAKAWEREGHAVPVAVNVAPILLTDPELPCRILGRLRAAGLAPSLLTVEITEEGIADASDAALTTIGTLRNAGIRISIDDFGTGYSSLAYLKRLPADELKIDRSFITHLASSPNDARIVTTIIDLAHSFGLSVVAEGVEDEPSAALLRKAGCDLAQGFGLHRPGPPAQVTEALAVEGRRLVVVA
jgi:diguanylate cyclase (GGDEF)-like protein